MKRILSLIVVVAAVAMVSCAGNTNKKAAEAAEAPAATEQVATECCGQCPEGECCKGDSTACCGKAACDKPCDKPCDKAAEGTCCKK